MVSPFMRANNGYDVFLGGSCGGTRWRQDIVIPYLRRVGISFYNPQRTAWTPEMIKYEESAKKSSKVLLFVIDCHQANVVGFIEIAYLAARKSPLVVVLPSDEEIGSGFSGGNKEDRLRTVKFLRNVLNRHNIPQFKSIDDALKVIEAVVISKKSFWDAINDVRCRFVYMRMMAKRALCKFSTAAKNAAAQLSPRQLVLPFKDPKLWRIFRSPNSSRTDWFKWNLLIIEVLLFFTLCVSCPNVPLIFLLGGVIFGHIGFLMLLPSRWIRGRYRSKSPRKKITPANYDVYLGGSGRLDWITEIALPILNKHGLSYLDASYCEFEQRLTMVPFCRFVVYVVSCTDTFLSGLVELAYFIGTGNKVIGCISANIPNCECAAQDYEDCGLTERMAENYRRGLLYLKDMASIRGMEVLDNLSSSILFVIERIRSQDQGDHDHDDHNESDQRNRSELFMEHLNSNLNSNLNLNSNSNLIPNGHGHAHEEENSAD